MLLRECCLVLDAAPTTWCDEHVRVLHMDGGDASPFHILRAPIAFGTLCYCIILVHCGRVSLKDSLPCQAARYDC